MMKYFMIAALIGVIVVVGTTVILAPQLAIKSANPPFGLPQANLIATLTTGILSGNLPWIMIIVGIIIAIVCWMLGLSIMTVALGFYLPISTTSIILVGGLAQIIDRKTDKRQGLTRNPVILRCLAFQRFNRGRFHHWSDRDYPACHWCVIQSCSCKLCWQ